MNIIDFDIEQGSTFNDNITLNEDLTGYTVRCNIEDGNGTVFKGFGTITDESNGTINIHIDDGITAIFDTGLGYYAIELEDTNGTVTKPIKGRLYIEREIV